MKVSRLLISALYVSLGLLLLTNVAAASASYLISYGDSLSDNGNLFSVVHLPLPPYYMGRASNGPVMVEDLAKNAGLTLLDFSFGGATTGIGNSLDGGSQTSFGSLHLPGMSTELKTSLPTITPIASQSIAVVWGGPEDIFTGGSLQLAVKDILSIVATLQGLHTMEIIVPGMPDLGLTPQYHGDATATAASIAFNTLLKSSLPNGVVFFDTFAFLHAVVADHGFTNVTDACYNGDYFGNYTFLCPNPNQYLFWDGLHPTAAGHEVLAEAIGAQAVPEPASLLLLGSGVVGLGGLLRRRLFLERG